jgi:hypothetical protein
VATLYARAMTIQFAVQIAERGLAAESGTLVPGARRRNRHAKAALAGKRSIVIARTSQFPGIRL